VTADSSAEATLILNAFAETIRNLDLDISATTVDNPEIAPDSTSWYVANATSFWRQLKPGARDALVFIASNSPEVSITKVANAVGMAPTPQFAGTMASIGWAAKALGAPSKPINRVRDAYQIDPIIARALLAAANEAGT
jgi:hypothetical protein